MNKPTLALAASFLALSVAGPAEAYRAIPVVLPSPYRVPALPAVMPGVGIKGLVLFNEAPTGGGKAVLDLSRDLRALFDGGPARVDTPEAELERDIGIVTRIDLGQAGPLTPIIAGGGGLWLPYNRRKGKQHE